MKIFCLLLIVISFQSFVSAQEKLQLNKQAPSVQFEKYLDKKLDSGFYKNKLLVLDFWATWCAPCIAGFPHFNELSKKFSSKNILFVAITNENEKTVKRFFERTKKELLAFKLIDTADKTAPEFEINEIPQCIIIDKNNVLKWKGPTYNLTESLLDSIIQNKYVAEKEKKLPEQPVIKKEKNKPINERALFSFSVANSDTSKTTYEGGGFSMGSSDEFYELSRTYKLLSEFIEEMTGYSKTARLITNDSIRFNKSIDVYFKTKISSLQSFSSLKNKYIPNSISKNLILDLLSNALNFSIEPIKKDTTFYTLVVTDSAKLHSFISMQQNHSSWSDDVPLHLEIVHYPLKEIAVILESKMGIIIKSENDNNKYDLSLNTDNIDELNKRLQFHGLLLKQNKGEVDIMKIIFH